MNYKKLFSATRPVKLFFIASLPGAISMLASALYQLLDGVFVGHVLGNSSFAALNLAFPFVIVNFALADLIGVGSAVPISVNLGRKQEEEANNIFSCSCLMIVVTGAATGALLYVLAPALIGMMGAEGNTALLAVRYLRVYAVCSPVTTIVFAMDNYLRICGKIRFSMFLNILMSVMSAGLEALFLFVFRTDIRGAALGTCLSMMICAVIATAPFAAKKLQLRFRRPRFHGRLIREIVTCGSPNFLNNIAGRVTSILMNTLLLRWGGEDAVNIYGVLMYADGFVQPLLYGMCDSLQPAVGYNWGEGKYSRVRAIERCCFIGAAAVSAAAAVVLVCFPDAIAGLFLENLAERPDFAAETEQAVRLFALTYLTRWFSFATQSYMLAVEKALPAALISVSTAFVFPVAWIGILWKLRLTGLWLNFALTALLAAILSGILLFLLRKGLWKPDEVLSGKTEEKQKPDPGV